MAVATQDKPGTIVLSRGATRIRKFASLQPIPASSVGDVRRTVASTNKTNLWISFERGLTDALLRSVDWPTKSLGDVLIVHKPNLASMAVLAKCFHRVAYCAEQGFLPDDELSEVLASSNRDNLLIGGTVDESSKTVILWRGNLEAIAVPFSMFPPSGDGLSADFSKFKIADCGQTIQLGDYEASTDSILYENDAEYRREVRKNQRKHDKSFGSSLRRLRKQRQLGRDDFSPLSDKTIARIERGEVKRVQSRTMSILAKKLQVEPEEIAEY